MRTALVCVRTAAAAQSIASCASRLGVVTLRTAVSETEALARLEEEPAELILADTGIGRQDLSGFTRRMLARAPQAVLILFGAEQPQQAAAVVAAGARGLIRGGEVDVVAAVAKALLLIGSPRRPPAGPPSPAAPSPAAPAHGAPAAPATAGPGPAGSELAGSRPAGSGTGGSGTGGSGTGGSGTGGSGPAGSPAVPPPHRPPPPGPGGRGGAWLPGASTPASPAESVVPVQRGEGPVPLGMSPLTERELQVLRGMAEGRSNAEIGRELYVSEDTVKTHARRLFRKLRTRDRAHAVAVGFRAGWLT